MIRSDIKLKELEGILNKDDSILIREKIEELRLEKPFEGAIALLCSCYDTTDDTSVKKSISSLMNDLKDPSVRTEVVTEIRKKFKSSTTTMLVSSCWQSGLDYSEYFTDFIKTFLSGDYSTAIECITVIEESAMNLTRARKDEEIKYIQKSPADADKDKKSLREELLLILER
jgi:hypothetical protein